MSGLRIGTFACSVLWKRNCLSVRNLQFTGSFNSIRNLSLTSTANMKYVQFYYNNKPNEIRAGLMVDGDVIDINKCDSSIPSTVLDILKGGFVSKVNNIKSSKPSVESIKNVTLVAPIYGMDKVMCIGLNYADHCKEQNLEPPPVPMIFSKFASTVIGPNEPVRLRTQVTQKVDWEVELVVVFGKKCSNVKAADAMDYVFGYTIAQDISSRDWQKARNGGQFLLGKSQDTFCPIGPCIVTSDEIGNPDNLKIKCSLNGVEKQTSNTSNLIHKIPDVIERLSSVMTLLPGDILLTGTPGGVGLYRQPPEFLKPGDELDSEIERIGSFKVKVAQF